MRRAGREEPGNGSQKVSVATADSTRTCAFAISLLPKPLRPISSRSGRTLDQAVIACSMWKAWARLLRTACLGPFTGGRFTIGWLPAGRPPSRHTCPDDLFGTRPHRAASGTDVARETRVTAGVDQLPLPVVPDGAVRLGPSA